jgi:RNA-directed DNA polymerase
MPPELVPDLSKCETKEQLAIALGVDPGVLDLLGGDEAVMHYQRHSIPKRSKRSKGEYRVVFEPVSEELRQVHKTLGRRLVLYAALADPTFPAACSFGYRRNRSIKDNAAIHCGAPKLLRADIRDFFPTVTRSRVESLLVRLGIPDASASLLSRIFCFNGSLTPGLSGSPLLANLACHDLDRRLSALAAEYDANYTRYADDLSFSGASLPGKEEIATQLTTEGFSLSDRKFRITKTGQSHFVTGLSISDPARPHVPKMMKRRLRQELYYCKEFGIQEHLVKTQQNLRTGVNRIDGTVKYVSFIERGTRHDYRAPWEALLARDDTRPTFFPQHDRPPIHKYCVIDESIISVGTVRYMAIACALFTDIDKIEATGKKILDRYLSDPYSAGKKSDIQKEGLHFTAAHAELQNQFILELPILPFRCYVAVKRLSDDASYSSVYLELVKWAAPQIYARCDREILTVRIEQNAEVSRRDLEEIFYHRYALLNQAGIRRPLVEPKVEIVSKKSQSIAVPDFMLGVLREFVEKDAKGGGAPFVRFERLRDRYSLIYDLDKKLAYRRRNPFQSEVLKPAP